MQTANQPCATPQTNPKELLSVTRVGHVRLELRNLTSDPVFTPRIGISKSHVLDLARALRACGDLDPIKVWSGAGTSSPIILDGHHRVTAYRFCKIESIPVIVFHGSRKDARLEAAKDNSKTTFPWSTSECTQYAWGLVIEGEASKREVSSAAAVSIGTVTNMRKRLSEMKTSGAIPTGNWWQDRSDKNSERPPEDDSDEAKQARVAKLREWLQGTEKQFKIEFGRRFTPDELGIAMRWHLGQARFKLMASGGCLVDEDEFSKDPELQPIEPLQNPTVANGSSAF